MIEETREEVEERRDEVHRLFVIALIATGIFSVLGLVFRSVPCFIEMVFISLITIIMAIQIKYLDTKMLILDLKESLIKNKRRRK